MFGQTIECVGTFVANKSMDMFGTAISSIHKVHGHTGNYEDECDDCQNATGGFGCDKHTRGALRVRQGNPTAATMFVNNKKSLRDPNYQAKSATQLDPMDIRIIRDALLSTNTIRCLV